MYKPNYTKQLLPILQPIPQSAKNSNFSMNTEFESNEMDNNVQE